MNRREFNTSMAAFATAPLVPVGAPISIVGAPAAALAPSLYAWAELIARAQNHCSPVTLARHLKLDDPAATQLFEKLIAEGVLHNSSALGMAQAARPIEATGRLTTGVAEKLRSTLDIILHQDNSDHKNAPLVKAHGPELGCDTLIAEETQNARTDEPFQNCPEPE